MIYTARCVVPPAGSPHAAELVEAGYRCCPMPKALRLHYPQPTPSITDVYEIYERVVMVGKDLLPTWRASPQACELMATVLVDPVTHIPTMHDKGVYCEQ